MRASTKLSAVGLVFRSTRPMVNESSKMVVTKLLIVAGEQKECVPPLIYARRWNYVSQLCRKPKEFQRIAKKKLRLFPRNIKFTHDASEYGIVFVFLNLAERRKSTVCL